MNNDEEVAILTDILLFSTNIGIKQYLYCPFLFYDNSNKEKLQVPRETHTNIVYNGYASPLE